MNPDTIGCVGTSEFDLNTLRVDGEIFESGKKKFENIRIRVDRALFFELVLMIWNQSRDVDVWQRFHHMKT